jgi:hypothetical protein
MIQSNTAPDRPDSSGNTSGQGKDAIVPNEVIGWNSGAFFLNWIWGIGNNTWRALLVFIPIFGFVWLFFLGFKGNEWAWKHKRWDNIEHFKRVQRKWSIAGFIFLAALVLLTPVMFLAVGSVFKNSEPYRFAMARIQQDERVVQALGQPIEAGMIVMGNLRYSGPSGAANLSIPVSGSRASGTAYVIATKRLGRWTISDLVVDEEDTGVRIIIIPESGLAS